MTLNVRTKIHAVHTLPYIQEVYQSQWCKKQVKRNKYWKSPSIYSTAIVRCCSWSVFVCVCVSMCAHVSSGHTNIHLLFYLGAMEGKRPCPIIANTESEQQQQQKTQKEQIVFVLNFYSVWNWMPIYFGFLFPWKHKEWIDFMDPYRKFDSKYVRVLDVRRHELHESTRNRDNKGNCVITIEWLERVNAERQTNWQRIKNEKVNVTNRKMNILSTQYRFTS